MHERAAAYILYAELFEYPCYEIVEKAYRLYHLLANYSKDAMNCLEKFIKYIEGCSHGRLEEIYTSTFDLQPLCYPYAGFHIFGDDYRRSHFMTGLKHHYRQKGFSFNENELPDHIAIILRYMGAAGEDMVIQDECLIPVLEKMVSLFSSSSQNPYFYLLNSLLLFLKNSSDTCEISSNDGGNNHE